MLNTIQGFHLELTNMCTLKCPRCARTQFIESFPSKWVNKNLNLEHLKQFLDIDLTDKTFRLCGNYGDPIYYKDLFKFISWAKQKNANIFLVTNGSYQTTDWWHELTSLLDDQDVIEFSIDGLPESFTKYRVNADWPSIEQGIKIVTKGPAKTTWKFIPFSFNEHEVEQAKQLSNDYDITNFYVQKSYRWEDENDWLKPAQPILFKNKVDDYYNNNIEIEPICIKNNNEHYISADGFYMPCCFVGDYRFYYKSEFFKNNKIYDISKTTITKILTETEFFKTINETRPNYCILNCSRTL
jgi:MoaA/NifB/PqqE/SkfB family radical SAM enzyme